MRLTNGLRTVALIEAVKGVAVLLAGVGLFALIHHDLQRFAERLVHHAHLNPASRYPRIFLDLSSHLSSTRLWELAIAAVCYSLVRFIEAYGLWRARRWAAWFSALSGLIYIPFELEALDRHRTWLNVGTLAVNVAIVAFMVYSLFRLEGKAADTGGSLH